MSKPARRTQGDAPILVTMGEPAGIGPEIAVAAFKTLGGRLGDHPLKLVGDASVFASCGFDDQDAFIATRARAIRSAGKPLASNAAAVIEAIDTAVALAADGAAAAIVTAPINKAVLVHGGFAHPGHTEYLQALTGVPRAVMLLASDQLRVAPLTIHTALASVPTAITTQSIVDTGEIILCALTRYFALPAPRLAVSGLNPHAGEDGVLGGEERAVIAPAVQLLKARGHDVRGPLPADTMFHAEARANYDAALCMFHDQALIPIKTLSFWDGVNVTLGLPIIRTSPDHGTAFDIAGTGKADARSMIAAIRMAARMADATRLQAAKR
jgi:4-hydroxythreonine-4-phosphate dehydrogenase